MEIFFLYKFYIFFIFKSYLKKKKKAVPQTRTVGQAWEGNVCISSLCTDSPDERRLDGGRANSASVAKGHSVVSTIEPTMGTESLHISTLTPGRVHENVYFLH